MAAQLAGGGAIEVWFARQGLAASACLAVGSVFGLLELTLARRLKLGSWLRRATWPRPSGFQVAMAMVLTGCLFVAGLGVVTALHR